LINSTLKSIHFDCESLEDLSISGFFSEQVFNSFSTFKNLLTLVIQEYAVFKIHIPKFFLKKIPLFFPQLRALRVKENALVERSDLQKISNHFKRNEKNVSIFSELHGQIYPQEISETEELNSFHRSLISNSVKKMKNFEIWKFFNTWKSFRNL
jgi:archaellum biogenesis ATPase FlaH